MMVWNRTQVPFCLHLLDAYSHVVQHFCMVMDFVSEFYVKPMLLIPLSEASITSTSPFDVIIIRLDNLSTLWINFISKVLSYYKVKFQKTHNNDVLTIWAKIPRNRLYLWRFIHVPTRGLHFFTIFLSANLGSRFHGDVPVMVSLVKTSK